MTEGRDTRAGLDGRRARAREMFQSADVLLSPMAGVSDLVFRALCRERGADVTYCEFVSADGVLHGNQSTRDLMELGEDEHPVGIQLFGSDPHSLAEAAAHAETLGPDLIDLNFGCPVKKIVKKNGGSALLCDVPRMDEIVRAVVAATSLPVTAKIRLGWSQESMNYLEVTEMLEAAGVCAITVHGRTREQRFTGQADWGPIGEIKRVARVPVIGNGDVWSGEDYLRMRGETGCDAVMIARASIGNPWIFAEVKAAIRGELFRPPDLDSVVETMIEHLDREIGLKGERVGVNRMKRHFGAYLKGRPGAAEIRKALYAAKERAVAVAALEQYRRGHSDRWAA